MQTNNADSECIYLLRDYKELNRYWRVQVDADKASHVEEVQRAPNEFVHGMFTRCKLGGVWATMGFLSNSHLEALPGAPDYSKNLVIIVDEKLLGDGFTPPQIAFRKGSFARYIDVRSGDAWHFHARYRVPFIREVMRRLSVGGTLDYDPADFVERLVEIVRMHRRSWLVESA